MRFLLLMTILYFLPSIIAHSKRDFGGIVLLNIFLGWTVIGWVAALIWACVSPHMHPPVLVAAGVPGRFCSRCGAHGAAGARFCWACGQPCD